MSRTNPAILFGFFVAIIVAMCGAALMKGGLYVGKHEGDTFHLLQIVFRMVDGQWPHLDFMTPIGALSFAPIAMFAKLGFGIGTSVILAQTFVVIIFLPAIWYAAYTRLSGALPYLFGLIVIVLMTALVHGEADRSVSISMHYNRWAWGISYVAITLAIFPPKDTIRPNIDGLIIGFSLACLAMIKVTYFAAFAGPVLFALLMQRAFRTGIVAIAVGVGVAAIITLAAGMEYWTAYLGDVLTVAQSENRPNPSADFGTVVGAPAYLGGSLLLLFGVILLRQARQDTGGLLLLLLAPGFFYVTYQNYGNDPQWLPLLGIILLGFQPAMDLRNGFGWEMRGALKVAAMAALAFGAPSTFNLLFSPFRQLGQDVTKYAPVLPGSGVHEDLQTIAQRSYRIDARIALDESIAELSSYNELTDRGEPAVVLGETLPYCEMQLGLVSWFDAIASDLEEWGARTGDGVFVTDLFSSHWLFGALEPLKGGAPWHYAGLPGFDDADYVLVPFCPVSVAARSSILKNVETSGVELREVRRTPLYILFAK